MEDLGRMLTGVILVMLLVFMLMLLVAPLLYGLNQIDPYIKAWFQYWEV